MEKRIIEGALHIVEKQGVKFTMDELASELGMSKKTIYTVFRDKNELLIAMVDYVFDYIIPLTEDSQDLRCDAGELYGF